MLIHRKFTRQFTQFQSNMKKGKQQEQEKATKKVLFYRALKLAWDQWSKTSTIHGIRHFHDQKANFLTKYWNKAKINKILI
jgi:hypothetical protein